MPGSVDAKKHCSSMKTEALRRSCEVLTQECNEQQSRNANSYALVGPNGQTVRMPDAARCFQASRALVLRQGPLPTSRLNKSKPAGSSARPPAHLQPALAACDMRTTPGSDANKACRNAVEACAATPGGPYSIETENQSYAAGSQNECMAMAPVISGFGKPIRRVVSASQNSPVSPPLRNAASPGGRVDAAGPPPAAKGSAEKSGGNGQPTPAASETQRAKCDARSTPGTPVNTACRAAIDACVAGPAGTYTLETDKASYSAQNKDECIAMAPIIAGYGYSISRVVANPPEPQNPSSPSRNDSAANPSQNAAPPPEQPPPATDTATVRLVKSFHDVNMRLRVTNGAVVEVKRRLLFNGARGVKGIPITMKYTLTRLESGAYRMAYAIYNKDGVQVSDKRSLDFQANGGHVSLGFEVRLWSADNFGSVSSIRVVPL